MSLAKLSGDPGQLRRLHGAPPNDQTNAHKVLLLCAATIT